MEEPDADEIIASCVAHVQPHECMSAERYVLDVIKKDLFLDVDDDPVEDVYSLVMHEATKTGDMEFIASIDECLSSIIVNLKRSQRPTLRQLNPRFTLVHQYERERVKTWLNLVQNEIQFWILYSGIAFETHDQEEKTTYRSFLRMALT